MIKKMLMAVVVLFTVAGCKADYYIGKYYYTKVNNGQEYVKNVGRFPTYDECIIHLRGVRKHMIVTNQMYGGRGVCILHQGNTTTELSG